MSFDPRGTGASRPIDCVDDAFLDLGAGLPAVPSTAAQLDAVHRYNEQFAAGCVQRMGAYAGQVGTRNVARDVEAIRIALGQPKLDYLGYSYGTIVGSTYAQMFPTAVGHMVLDGPPDYSLTARDYAYQQARGFMNALGAFLDWCQQTGCSLASAGAPRDVLQQLIARVDQQPLPASYTLDGVTRDGVLTPSLLENAVIAMLYDRSRGWPILADALLEAVQQGQGASLLSLADQFLGRGTDGAWNPLVEANAVIGCVDRPTKRAPSTTAELADVATFQAQLPPWGGSWATGALCRDAQARQGRQARRGLGRAARHRSWSSARPATRRRRTPGRRRWWAASPAHSSSRSTAPSTPPTDAASARAPTTPSTRTSWRARCRPWARTARPTDGTQPRTSRCRRTRSAGGPSRISPYTRSGVSHSRSNPTATRSPRSLVAASCSSSNRTPNASSPKLQCSPAVSHTQLGPEPFGAHHQLLTARRRHVVVVHHDHADVREREARRERGGSARRPEGVSENDPVMPSSSENSSDHARARSMKS